MDTIAFGHMHERTNKLSSESGVCEENEPQPSLPVQIQGMDHSMYHHRDEGKHLHLYVRRKEMMIPTMLNLTKTWSQGTHIVPD